MRARGHFYTEQAALERAVAALTKSRRAWVGIDGAEREIHILAATITK